MKSVISTAALVVALVGLGLSPTLAHAGHPAAPVSTGYGPEADYPVTIGDPYVIGGVTYTPADTLNYDAVGYAHAGTQGSGISGAHHVLPLPCYVEVTSLDSGHTILVRLDRRGPMNGKQLIELSPAAWAQLGLPAGADAAVRVRRVNPPEPERAALRMGNRAPERMETPPGLRTALRRRLVQAAPRTPDEPPSATLSGSASQTAAHAMLTATNPAPPHPVPARPPVSVPTPTAVATPKPVVAKPAAPKPAPPTPPKPKPVEARAESHHAEAKHLVVQVAAFSSREHAEKAAEEVGGKVEAAGKLWRVRIVATSDEAAQAALAKARHSGYAGAIILHHD
ncbi:SPOR domain-containing protein [Novosphingobium sp. FSW06-99]|uniref:SPOR domain-containing protein n=1 Tax=Novosphingobium sp. FSW06-99 TaxID=1739113 RepID=UPI00076C97BA|nr:SPOR domain-containing protein [Novosphingobium sp. FSW06-99]KUR80727.1 sporulation protein [Novosphingobium sp. FSW06-99]